MELYIILGTITLIVGVITICCLSFNRKPKQITKKEMEFFLPPPRVDSGTNTRRTSYYSPPPQQNSDNGVDLGTIFVGAALLGAFDSNNGGGENDTGGSFD